MPGPRALLHLTGRTAAFDLYRAVKIALVALAVSPVPPVLPRKRLTSGGDRAYAASSLMAAALCLAGFRRRYAQTMGGAEGGASKRSAA